MISAKMKAKDVFDVKNFIHNLSPDKTFEVQYKKFNTDRVNRGKKRLEIAYTAPADVGPSINWASYGMPNLGVDDESKDYVHKKLKDHDRPAVANSAADDVLKFSDDEGGISFLEFVALDVEEVKELPKEVKVERRIRKENKALKAKKKEGKDKAISEEKSIARTLRREEVTTPHFETHEQMERYVKALKHKEERLARTQGSKPTTAPKNKAIAKSDSRTREERKARFVAKTAPKRVNDKGEAVNAIGKTKEEVREFRLASDSKKAARKAAKAQRRAMRKDPNTPDYGPPPVKGDLGDDDEKKYSTESGPLTAEEIASLREVIRVYDESHVSESTNPKFLGYKKRERKSRSRRRKKKRAGTEAGSYLKAGVCVFRQLLSQLGDDAVALGAFIYQIYSASSYKDYLSSCILYAKSLGIKICHTVTTLFSNFWSTCRSAIRYWTTKTKPVEGLVFEEKYVLDDNGDLKEIGKEETNLQDLEARLESIDRAINKAKFDKNETELAKYVTIRRGIVTLLEKSNYEFENPVYDWKEDPVVAPLMYDTEAGIVDRFSTMFYSLMSGSLIAGIRNMLLALASFRLLGRVVDSSIFRMFGYPGSMTVIEFVDYMIEAIKNISSFISSLANGVPFTEALLSKDPILSTCEALDEMVRMKEYTYSGLPTTGHTDLRTYIQTMENHIGVLTCSIKGLNPVSAIGRRAKRLIADCEVILAEKKALAFGAMRSPPIGVIITGDSSIGKSFIIRYVEMLWSTVKGREFDDSQVFPRNATSVYWEGYMPFSHPIVRYSEIARVSENVVKVQGDDQITEIVTVIDGQEFRPDMAFTNKGKLSAIPEMVIGDTNNDTLNADILYACPVAYLRRFIFIKPVVMTQFRKSGSTAIDPNKANAAPGHFLDRYYFDVYSYRPDGKKRNKVVYCEQARLGQMTTILKGLFENHIANNEKAIQRNTDMEICLDDSDEKLEVPADLPLSIEDEILQVKSQKKNKKKPLGSKGEIVFHKEEDLPKIDVEEFSESESPEQYDTEDEEKMNISRPRTKPKPKTISNKLPPAKTAYWNRRVAFNNSTISPKYAAAGASEVRKRISAYTESGPYVSFNFALSFADVITFLVSMLRQFFTLVLTYVLSEIWRDAGDWKIVTKARVLAALLFLVVGWSFPMLLFTCCFFISFGNLARRFEERMFSRMELWLDGRYQRSVRSLQHHVLGRVYNPFRLRPDKLWWYKAAAIAAASTASVLTAYKLYRAYKKEEDIPVESGTLTEDRAKLFESLQLGSVSRVVPVNDKPNIWNVQRDNSALVVDPPCHTLSLESLDKVVANNTRVMALLHADDPAKTTILFIQPGVFIFNEHALRGKDSVEAAILDSSAVVNNNTRFVLERKKCVQITDDLLMYTVTFMRARDIVKHFATETPKTFKAMIKGSLTRATVRSDPICFNDKYLKTLVINTPTVSYQWAAHYAGACGSALTGELARGYAIYAFHVAGLAGEAGSYGILVTRSQIEAALAKLPILFPFHSESGMLQLDALGAPGPKSLVRYEDLGAVEYWGKIDSHILMNKKGSKLRVSSVADDVVEFFDEHKIEYENTYPPVMGPKIINGEYANPYNNNVRKMTKPKKHLDEERLARIADFLIDHIVEGLAEKGITSLNPVTLSEAINGVEDDPFFKRINASTSGGFGFPGVKAQHLPLGEDGVTRGCTEQLMNNVAIIIERYLKGLRAFPVYKAQLKDEPRSRKKVEEAMTRMFYMQSLDHLLVHRMFLGPFYTLLPQHPKIFRSRVGINIYKEADEYIEEMREFSPNILEGDYGAFDVSMPVGIGACVARIVTGVLKRLGYTDDQLRVVRGIFTDNLFPFVEILTDIFCIPGLQPSGKYATAEDNSLRGLIMLMYAWEEMGFKLEDFFKNVLPNTYGDDLAAAVREKKFNAREYARIVEEIFGMKFTDPAKNVVFPDFVTLKETTFLKRSFEYEEKFGKIVAKLSSSSILKGVYWNIPSKSVTSCEQTFSSVVSACYEMGITHPHLFEAFKERMMTSLINKANFTKEYLVANMPTFSDVHAVVCGSEEYNPALLESGIYEPLKYSSYLGTPEHVNVPLMGEPDDDRFKSSRLLIKQPAEQKEEKLQDIRTMTKEELMIEMKSSPEYDLVFRGGAPVGSALRDPEGRVSVRYKEVVSEYYDRIYTEFARDLFTESGELDLKENPTMATEENFTTILGDGELSTYQGTSMYPDIGQSEQLELDRFFKRPVEIHHGDLPLGDHVSLIFPVWDMYTLNPTVRAKLRNYAYFSADMHVRINVSGSPFHYGKILFSYQPFGVYNPTLKAYYQVHALHSQVRPLLLNYLSQAPGSAVMDVKANKPLEMTFPFISPTPVVPLFNKNNLVISPVTSYSEVAPLGELYMYTINVPKSTTTGASSPKVAIYAWLENVKLGVPTATQVSIGTTESGSYDERVMGPMEKVFSAAKQISSALTKVPWIAPMAKASSIIFKGAESVSAAYGFSKPILCDEPTIVKNQPFQNGANTVGWDTSKRITLDPLQELPVDPRVCGTDTDDQDIAHIAKIPSYLTTFYWANSSPVMEPIWLSYVTPDLYTYMEMPSECTFQPTACAFASGPFQYWNGKVKFRFEVVASAFHRGKFVIFYEPNIHQKSLISSNLTTNRQYMAVIDIQETQTFEVEVDWASRRYWLKLNSNGPASAGKAYAETVSDLYTYSDTEEFVNGMIIVAPFTSIQSPDDSEVAINVYVSTEELQVNYLCDQPCPDQRYIWTESGNLNTEDPVMTMVINPTSGNLMQCAEYHFGERPTSFRALLKRFATDVTLVSGAITQLNGQALLAIDVPNWPNHEPKYSTTALTRVPCKTLFQYLCCAYLGQRGSTRRRLQIVGSNAAIPVGSHVKITNFRSTGWSANPAWGITGIGEIASTKMAGTVTYVLSTNGGVEYEVPFYSNDLFKLAFATEHEAATNFTPTWNRYHKITVSVDRSQVGLGFTANVDVAAGEDFSFMRYQGAPFFTAPLVA